MANDVEIKLNIAAEYKAAMTAIAQLSVALKKLQEQSKLVVGAGGKAGATTAPATVGISPELQKALEGQKTALAAAAAEMAKTQAALQTLIATSAAGADQLKLVADTIAKIQQPNDKGSDDDALSKMSEQLRLAMSEIERLQQAIMQLEAAQEAAATNAKRRNVQADQLSAADVKRHDRAIMRMQFEGLTRRELAKRIQELMKLRTEAAKQDDRDAWEGYNEQIRVATQSMEELTRRTQMNRIVLQQQVQTGIMLSEGMARIAQSVAVGNVNIGDMVTQVLQLSTAIKAGLGPIGWMMMAVQGLQLAWNAYSAHQEKLKKEEEERKAQIKEKEKALRDAKKAVDELTDAERREMQLNTIQAFYKGFADESARALRNIERTYNFENKLAQLEARRASNKFELGRLQLETRWMNGEITQEEYEEQLRGLETERTQQGFSAREKNINEALKKSQQELNIAEAEALKAAQKQTEVYNKERSGTYYDITPQEFARRRAAVDLANQKGDYNEADRILSELVETYGTTNLDYYTKEREAQQQRIRAANEGAAVANQRKEAAYANNLVAIRNAEIEREQLQDERAHFAAMQEARKQSATAKKAAAKRQQDLDKLAVEVDRMTEEELRREKDRARTLFKGAASGAERTYYKNRFKLASRELGGRSRVATARQAMTSYTGPEEALATSQGLLGLIGGEGALADEGLDAVVNQIKAAAASKSRDDDQLFRVVLGLLYKSGTMTKTQIRELKRAERKLYKRES